jgi:ribosomal protein L17
MRHKVAHRKLGRKTEHRLSLLRNLCASLIVHERLITTLPKAKELRPFAERAITKLPKPRFTRAVRRLPIFIAVTQTAYPMAATSDRRPLALPAWLL